VIITLIIQAKNEVNTGHLKRFVDYNLEITDNRVALDDDSEDGTREILNLHFGHVIENQISLFASEILNKQKLLVTAREKFPDTDWFLWLDADELLLSSREEIEKLILDAEKDGSDSIELGLVNLWRSEKYFRFDSGFNDVKNIRLWKNLEHLKYKFKPGLHQPSHPDGLRKTFRGSKLKILHFGFSSMNLICDKFLHYESSGQRGQSLWRLIDESDLELREISDVELNLGSRYELYLRNNSINPVINLQDRLSIWDYYWKNRINKRIQNEVKPKVTLICLIYAGVDWLEFQYGELLALSKEFSPGQIEILFVTNDATDSVIRFLDDNHIPYVKAPGRASKDEWYINSVYRAYNYGVNMASGDYVFLTNSDMSYTKGFLMSLFMHAGSDKYVVGKLVESGRLKPAEHAVEKNFGKILRRFKREKFNKFAESISEKGEIPGGLYMPSIVRKDVFQNLGGFPEGNIAPSSLDAYLGGKPPRYALLGEKVLPGDFAFMQKASLAGISHVTAQDAIAYHFQEGEKSDHSQDRNLGVSSGVGIANDVLLGINGESVLWNYVIDDLENEKVRVIKFALGFKPNFYRLRNKELWSNPKVRLMFRNGTFLGNFRGSWRTLTLLQDKIQNKKILKRQNKARSMSEAIITNTDYFIQDDRYILDSHKFLLPLPVNPIWEVTETIIMESATRLQAIFVGAFNETKGWDKVKSIIENHLDIDFVLVSKYSDDEHDLSVESIAHCKVYRNLPVTELVGLIDKSDYMIIGSQFETQCLAAMEAATRNKPVCMRDTGILSTLPEIDRSKVGVFNTDLVIANSEMIARLKLSSNGFEPRDTLLKYGLDSQTLRSEWRDVLLSELKESFLPVTKPGAKDAIKRVLPKFALRYLTSIKAILN